MPDTPSLEDYSFAHYLTGYSTNATVLGRARAWAYRQGKPDVAKTTSVLAYLYSISVHSKFLNSEALIFLLNGDAEMD